MARMGSRRVGSGRAGLGLQEAWRGANMGSADTWAGRPSQVSKKRGPQTGRQVLGS